MPKGVPNKRYTPEFKRMVVETIEKENLSIRAAMQEFGINDHKIIERWERIYLEEGPEGLAIERRGRSSGTVCQSSYRSRLKKICWQKSSGCVRRMTT